MGSESPMYNLMCLKILNVAGPHFEESFAPILQTSKVVLENWKDSIKQEVTEFLPDDYMSGLHQQVVDFDSECNHLLDQGALAGFDFFTTSEGILYKIGMHSEKYPCQNLSFTQLNFGNLLLSLYKILYL